MVVGKILAWFVHHVDPNYGLVLMYEFRMKSEMMKIIIIIIVIINVAYLLFVCV